MEKHYRNKIIITTIATAATTTACSSSFELGIPCINFLCFVS